MSRWQTLRLGRKANDLYIDGKTGGRFVRCVLRLPVLGGDDTLEWGVWSSLSAANFKRYRNTFRSARQSELGEMFGWFSSQCPGYPETSGLKCHVVPQDGGIRPLIDLEPTDHPLAVDQRNGITPARAVELAGPWLPALGHKV
jgi:hypothetical protein